MEVYGGNAMSQDTLAKWLKVIIIGLGIFGVLMYGFVIPECGNLLVAMYPEFAYCYYPWMVFIWLTGVPCYAVLVLAWKVAANIGRDYSFSMDNSRLMKWIAGMALGDVTFFFVGNVVFLFLNMNHPGIVMASMLVVFIGVAVAVAAIVLSHLIAKAAVLKEQTDLTI